VRPEDRSLILDTCVRAVFHTILLLSLYLLFSGHNQPGGGFVGGLVAGAAFVLRYVAGGADEVHRMAPFRPQLLLGGGVVLAALTGVGSWLAGGDFLQHGEIDLELPLLGHLHAGSTLVFDIGVFLVVAGLVLTLLESLGDVAEAEEQEEAAQP
jgi:multisubunit Na+/H+ antiporter MnhB subunit